MKRHWSTGYSSCDCSGASPVARGLGDPSPRYSRPTSRRGRERPRTKPLGRSGGPGRALQPQTVDSLPNARTSSRTQAAWHVASSRVQAKSRAASRLTRTPAGYGPQPTDDVSTTPGRCAPGTTPEGRPATGTLRLAHGIRSRAVHSRTGHIARCVQAHAVTDRARRPVARGLPLDTSSRRVQAPAGRHPAYRCDGNVHQPDRDTSPPPSLRGAHVSLRRNGQPTRSLSSGGRVERGRRIAVRFLRTDPEQVIERGFNSFAVPRQSNATV